MSLADEAYDPFRRHDRYGSGGLARKPLSERLLLAALSLTVAPVKVAAALCCLVSFYAFCRLSPLIPAARRPGAVAAAGKAACRACLFCLGFVRVAWVRQDGAAGRDAGAAPPVVIVSNHCGWTDILVHMARFFPAFVARDSTAGLLMVGLISKKMGCLFVDRERGAGAANGQGVGSVLKRRVQKAARGESPGERPVLLFPEGTTTNGRFLLPFKSGAFLAGCPVQPVILRYGQGRVSPCWESISAAHHIWLMLCIPFHTVTAVELPVYAPSQEEAADPMLFARNVRSYMLKQGGLQPSASTLADKRAFHALLQGERQPVQKKLA